MSSSEEEPPPFAAVAMATNSCSCACVTLLPSLNRCSNGFSTAAVAADALLLLLLLVVVVRSEVGCPSTSDVAAGAGRCEGDDVCVIAAFTSLNSAATEETGNDPAEEVANREGRERVLADISIG